ncbi:MAG: hypothetical protein E6Z01_10795, partial [Actinomyces sp.]|nr:hypothetical protein [Actinomyces sp.]
MKRSGLAVCVLFAFLSLHSPISSSDETGEFEKHVVSGQAGSVTVESSFTEAVSVPGVEGAGVENVDAAGAGGVIEVVEGPVGGFRVPGWQVRCKIGTGTAGATPAD